jgi:hypothetical protein
MRPVSQNALSRARGLPEQGSAIRDAARRVEELQREVATLEELQHMLERIRLRMLRRLSAHHPRPGAS